jgi:hypothetical protein
MKATGFTIVEVLIALIIFQLTTLWLLQGQWRARQQVVVALQELKATALLFDIAASLQQLPVIPSELRVPIQQPLANVNECRQSACSATQQAISAMQPILARAFDPKQFRQAQLCISGNYPHIELIFSWQSYWSIQRNIGAGQCARSGAFHLIQIKLRAQ